MPESSIKNWDDLLREGLITPPEDFHASVMAQVALRPVSAQPQPAQPGRLPTATATAVQGVRMAVQAAALAAAAVAGLTQLAIFSFGIWSATAVG